MNGEFTIEYVELPNGRMPAREFVDSLDEKAAARMDAFIERLRVYGNRMQGKFVKKLTDEIFELRVKQFDRIFRVLFFYQPGMLIVITSGFQKKTQETVLVHMISDTRPSLVEICSAREIRAA